LKLKQIALDLIRFTFRLFHCKTFLGIWCDT